MTYEENATQIMRSGTVSMEELRCRLAQITFYGQVPYQLFESGHPQRKVNKQYLYEEPQFNNDSLQLIHQFELKIVSMFYAPQLAFYIVLSDYSVQTLEMEKHSAILLFSNLQNVLRKHKHPYQLGRLNAISNEQSILQFISSNKQLHPDGHEIDNHTITGG